MRFSVTRRSEWAGSGGVYGNINFNDLALREARRKETLGGIYKFSKIPLCWVDGRLVLAPPSAEIFHFKLESDYHVQATVVFLISVCSHAEIIIQTFQPPDKVQRIEARALWRRQEEESDQDGKRMPIGGMRNKRCH